MATKPFSRTNEATSPHPRSWPETQPHYPDGHTSDGDGAMTKTFHRAGLMIAVAFGLCVFSTSGFAFSADAQQMCTGDAFRLCSSEIPDIPAITACMVKHRADLSPGCRAVMDRDQPQKGG